MTFEYDLKAAVRTIRITRSPGSCFAILPRCSVTRARSAARSTNWCNRGRATRSTRCGHRGARASFSRAGGASGLRRLRADPETGKLPHTTVRIAYSLEYGLDEMEMHADAIHPGERVILVDDLIATGGTAEGAVKLMRQIGANVVAAASSSICRTSGVPRNCGDGRAGTNVDGVRGH